MTGHTEKGQWLLGAGLCSPLLKRPAHREALPGGLHATRLCSPRPSDRHITWAVMIRLCPPATAGGLSWPERWCSMQPSALEGGGR